MDIEASGLTLAPGSYTVTIGADGDTMACMITVNPNLPGGFTGTCDGDLGTQTTLCMLHYDPAPQTMPCTSLGVHLELSPERFIFFHSRNAGLSDLSVQVEHDGAVVIDKSINPDYKVIWDSDECNLHCTAADIHLELP